MITLRKLASLPRKTRLRKTIAVLSELERDCRSGRSVDVRYFRGLAELLREDERLGERLRAVAERAGTSGGGSAERVDEAAAAASSLCRSINALRNTLLAELGQEPAEWDLVSADSGELDAGARDIHDYFVYLEDLRSPYNVGAIFRTAESFGVRQVFLSPDTPRPDHPRAARSSMGACDVVPWSVCSFADAIAEVGRLIAATPAVFALETGGRPIESRRLPEPGLVVIGSEELGVSPEALSVAESSFGRVSIGSAGAKASLNVAVAFGILAHAWWVGAREGSSGARAHGAR